MFVVELEKMCKIIGPMDEAMDKSGGGAESDSDDVADGREGRPMRDIALTAIKVVSNAIPTTRPMGERGAPCFLGCGGGEDSRAHYLGCLEDSSVFCGAREWPGRCCAHGGMARRLGTGGVVGPARMDRGLAQLSGEASLVARLRAAARRFPVVAEVFAWANGAAGYRRPAPKRRA